MRLTRPRTHRMSPGAASGLAALTLALSACIGEDGVVEVGVIEHFADPIRIEAPATARVGQAFLVTVWSYGGGCDTPERTDVELTSEGAAVIPFVRTPDDESCVLILRSFRHSVDLSFDTPGTRTIAIHGRRVSFDQDERIVVPLAIDVE